MRLIVIFGIVATLSWPATDSGSASFDYFHQDEWDGIYVKPDYGSLQST